MPASFASLMYSFMGLPLLVILVLNLIGKKRINSSALIIGYIVAIVQTIAAAVSISLLWQYNKASINFSQFWDMKASDSAAFFSADILSLTAILAIGIVMFVAFFTGRTLLEDKAFNFTNLSMILMLGMNGIALVSDLFSLYVFLEITGIASFVLIALFRNNAGLEGAFKYLVISAIASLFILLGMAFLFINTQSLQYADITAALTEWDVLENPVLVLLSFVFLGTGFLIKAGIVPFHGWLPDAYESAPASVSIVLGGIVTKMAGVYALIRLIGNIVPIQGAINTCLMVFALISVVYGSIAAIGQTSFKRILAYSSISQIGYIILGITAGSVIGYIGAILHFFNHATFKTTLFTNSAAIEQQIGTTNIAELGGLQKQMPVTAVSSILAFLSTAGIPPLAGFWSKLLIIIAAWQTFGIGVGAIALVASLITIAYFLRLQRNVFFGPAKDEFNSVTEHLRSFKVAQIILSAITVFIGLAFPVLLLLLQHNAII